jgi:hypothetical protein
MNLCIDVKSLCADVKLKILSWNIASTNNYRQYYYHYEVE